MSVEELLKPRYKVIADYPKSLYNVGDILNAGWRSEDCIYCDTEGPRWRHYPHLFKKLEWWEERQPEEMPEYVKAKHGKVVKVAGFGNTGSGKLHIGWEDQKRGLLTRPASIFLPATKEEYESRLQSIEKGEAN